MEIDGAEVGCKAEQVSETRDRANVVPLVEFAAEDEACQLVEPATVLWWLHRQQRVDNLRSIRERERLEVEESEEEIRPGRCGLELSWNLAPTDREVFDEWRQVWVGENREDERGDPLFFR